MSRTPRTQPGRTTRLLVPTEDSFADLDPTITTGFESWEAYLLTLEEHLSRLHAANQRTHLAALDATELESFAALRGIPADVTALEPFATELRAAHRFFRWDGTARAFLDSLVVEPTDEPSVVGLDDDHRLLSAVLLEELGPERMLEHLDAATKVLEPLSAAVGTEPNVVLLSASVGSDTFTASMPLNDDELPPTTFAHALLVLAAGLAHAGTLVSVVGSESLSASALALENGVARPVGASASVNSLLAGLAPREIVLAS